MTSSNDAFTSLTPVLACDRCPALCENRNRIVNGRGPTNARIMIVGEAPGNDEDKQGKPFMGATGKLAARILDDAGIDVTTVYLSNAVRCRPPGNRKPSAKEIAACREYLLDEIKKVNPEVIVAMGGTAMASLLGKQVTLNTVAGHILTLPDLPPIIPTYHPAYFMRGKWTQIPMAVEHVRKARLFIDGKLTGQTLEDARENWVTCDTVEDVEALAEYLTGDAVSLITMDSETTGLDWMTDELLCVSFSALDTEGAPIRGGFTVPIMRRPAYVDDPSDRQIEMAWVPAQWVRVHTAIARIMACDKPKSIQNSIFDVPFFERERAVDACVTATSAPGWKVENLAFDPMLAQRLINERLPANETMLLSMYTDMPYYETDIKEQSRGKSRMDLADPKVLYEYAAADADGLARITAVMMGRLGRLWWLYENITMPNVRVAWNMTRRGIPVDLEYFERLCARYDQLVPELRAKVIEAAGEEFNPNSRDQLTTILFDKLGLTPSGRKTDKGRECNACNSDDESCDEHHATGKAAILDIRDAMKNPHPILDALIDYKETTKRKANWVNGSDGTGGLVRYIRPDTCIHPTFYPGRADTGRWSAVKPAIQTPPKNIRDEVLNTKDQIRRNFVAPPGRQWMEADWSQGEVWVMGYESGDEQLLALLKEGRDVHTFVARKLANLNISRVFPADIERQDLEEWEWKKEFDDYRKKAKVFVFGLDYGMTAIGAGERLACDPDEAQMLIDAFLQDVFPSLNDHFERVKKQLEDYGQLRNRFGRVGRFGDGAFIRSFGKRGVRDWDGAFRKAVNMPIQSGLSDLHQLVLDNWETDAILSKRFPMILAIHDSATGLPEGGRDDLIQTAWMLKERAEDMARHYKLENGKELGWEIPMEIQWGPTWGDYPYVLMADGNFKEPEAA